VPVAVDAIEKDVGDGTAVTSAPFAGAVEGVSYAAGSVPETNTPPPTESPWSEAVVYVTVVPLPDAPVTAIRLDGMHGPTITEPTRSQIPLKSMTFGQGAVAVSVSPYSWPALAGGVVAEL
jgi:hypothetical protein